MLCRGLNQVPLPRSAPHRRQPHDCSGQPLPIVAKVVGWRLSTVVEMAERYGHFEEDALRRAIESIRTPPQLPHDLTYAQGTERARVQ